jgi:hypothetical protein
MGLSDKAMEAIEALDLEIKTQQTAVELRANIYALKTAIEVCEGNEGKKLHLQIASRPGIDPFAVDALTLAAFLANYVDAISGGK